MVRATPLNLMIGLLAAAGAAKAATSLPAPQLGAAAGNHGARVILASASPPAEHGKTEAAPKAAPPAATAEAPKDAPLCETPEDLLLSIQQERALLAKRKAALDAREAKLALAQQSVETETKKLGALKAEVEGLLNKATAKNRDDLDRLVKLYKAMKPAQAASILNNADLEVTVMVLATMNERNAAAIMAKMSATRVQAVSKIILERSKLPGDQNVVRVKLD